MTRLGAGVLLILLLVVPRAAAQSSTTAQAPPVTAGWQNGFVLQSADGDYRLQLGGLIQADGRFSVDDPLPITNTFVLRRARPILAGRLARYFDFRLMPDFGSGAAVLFDAYLDFAVSPALRIRAGKDKTPVGYELLISDPNLLFPERALPSNLVPNRDIGIQAQGEIAGGTLTYAAGIFNGVPDGASTTTDVDTNSDKDLAGRVVVQPWRSRQAGSALKGLGIHLGASRGTQSGALPSFRTSVGQLFFSYATGTSAAGARWRVSPTVFYYVGRLGGFVEYARTTQRVAQTTTHRDLTNHGWTMNAVYNLTGETASSGAVSPKTPFDGTRHHLGALQLVARYSDLSIDEATFDAGLASAESADRARQFTIGANWLPVGFAKYYVTYERTEFRTPGPAGRASENVILFRVQGSF